MKPAVYLETSVINYPAARPSRDLVTAANQQITHAWWRKRQPLFEVFASPLVWEEASAGDQIAAARRQQLLLSVPLLQVSEEAQGLAWELLQRTPLPDAAAPDALHIALAACHGIDYLLT